MDKRELLKGLLTNDPEAVSALKKMTSGPAKSAAVYAVPINGTLPDHVPVYLEGTDTTLGELKRRNTGRGVWALFAPWGKFRPYAVFDGSEALPVSEWPTERKWRELNPLNSPDPDCDHTCFPNFKDAQQVGGHPDNWTIPGFAWANR